MVTPPVKTVEFDCRRSIRDQTRSQKKKKEARWERNAISKSPQIAAISTMSKNTGEKLNADTPRKGAKGYISKGKNVYTKVILFLDNPTTEDEGKRFFLCAISDLNIQPKYFLNDLSDDMRRERIQVGMYTPDRDVRVFAKVQRSKYLRARLDDLKKWRDKPYTKRLTPGFGVDFSLSSKRALSLCPLQLRVHRPILIL